MLYGLTRAWPERTSFFLGGVRVKLWTRLRGPGLSGPHFLGGLRLKFWTRLAPRIIFRFAVVFGSVALAKTKAWSRFTRLAPRCFFRFEVVFVVFPLQN